MRAGGSNLDLPLLATIYDAPTATQPRFLPELLDLEAQRRTILEGPGRRSLSASGRNRSRSTR